MQSHNLNSPPPRSQNSRSRADANSSNSSNSASRSERRANQSSFQGISPQNHPGGQVFNTNRKTRQIRNSLICCMIMDICFTFINFCLSRVGFDKSRWYLIPLIFYLVLFLNQLYVSILFCADRYEIRTYLTIVRLYKNLRVFLTVVVFFVLSIAILMFCMSWSQTKTRIMNPAVQNGRKEFVPLGIPETISIVVTFYMIQLFYMCFTQHKFMESIKVIHESLGFLTLPDI